MKITLKNNELMPTISFLQNISLKGKDSRHRTKFVKQLQIAFDALVEAEKDLMNDFGLLDENKELLPGAEQDKTSVKFFQSEQKILFEEEVIIEGGTFAKNFDEIPRILNEYEGELSGEQADIYDKLLDQMEEQQEEKNNNKKKAAEK